jgi:O-acetyl-ADP-ribose deacetylase (regulator of RNase III)
MISYVVGDATFPLGTDERVIVHVCNNRGGWGKGFVLALSKRWSEPERAYKAWAAREPLELGKVQLVRVEDSIQVANVVAQDGYIRPTRPVPLDYVGLQAGLAKLAERESLREASFHMPRIGSKLGGGDWARIEVIVEATLGVDHAVTVYDLPKGAA